jgi:hypothetical protein
MSGSLILEPKYMSKTNLILMPPPKLRQTEIYHGEEGDMACWATSAEMITKWKKPNAYFVRPEFKDKLPQSGHAIATKNANTPNAPGMTQKAIDDAEFLSKVAYQDYVDEWLAAWGFRPENYSSKASWTGEELVQILREKGPLLCTGKFFPGGNSGRQIGGQAHVIAVYGFSERLRGVYYIDPWDGQAKEMPLDAFNNKIEKINKGSIQTRVTNWDNPENDYQPVFRTLQQTPVFQNP